MSEPAFIPGRELAGLFYTEAVRPILDTAFPDLPHAAALLGTGSEVLGFDTLMSTDHSWGPRVTLYLSPDDHDRYAAAIDDALRRRLPHSFRGYTTNFSEPDANDHGVQLMRPTADGPVNHAVEIVTARRFFIDYLRFDIERPLEPADWLTFAEQKLATLRAGGIYHDDLGLSALRDQFDYYPHDVWLYLLAAGWTRIGQEEHLMGRAGYVGDEIGSALIGSRLVRDLMRLCFLMERQYAPYPKWFGTAFARLRCAPPLMPLLRAAQLAETWQAREAALAPAYEQVAALHNALGLTPPLPAETTSFFGRPFRVIMGDRFARALAAAITDPAVAAIAARKRIGSIDQFSDSTDLVADPIWRPLLRHLYE
jgi:hypothetical protein